MTIGEAAGHAMHDASAGQHVFSFDDDSGELQLWHAGSRAEPITHSGIVALAGFVANRAQLQQQHGVLATDAGLIEAMWRQQGARAAAQLCGDAAWIAFDAQQRKLTAARDRMGMHCVYHAAHGNQVWLSLSLDALLACWPGRRELNPSAIVRQLNAQAPVEGETHFAGIQALHRGCALTLTPGKQHVQRYWEMRLLPVLRLESDEAYAEAYRSVLFDVARGYAPSGRAAVTLSSGMDSSSVAAALREVAPALDLQAMTWTTPELAEADELAYVKETAGKLDIPLHVVRGDQHWTLSHPDGARTNASSPFALYYDDLWDAAHACIRDAGATTVFDGFSGDALFGANVYAYPDLFVEGRWLQLAREMRAHMRLTPSGITWPQALRRMVLGPVARAYLPGLMKSRVPAPAPWLSPSQHALWQSTQQPAVAQEGKPGRRMRFNFVADNFASQVGIHYNSLARRFGLEPRHVLLDHRLVELALSLPTEQTIRNGQRKTIMRNAMRGRLPDSVLDMWGKIVPTTLSERGLREREQAKIRHYLTNMRAAELGYVDEDKLRSAYSDYLDNKTQNALFFYAVTLEDWLRRYF